MNKLNPSIKHHLVIAILISLWLFVFAFVIKPFDDGTINFRAWFLISFGFSVMAFLCYGLLAFIQKSFYKRIGKWNISLEITAIFLFYVLYLIGVFAFYKSPILNGGYDFSEFFSIIFIKVALILTPVIILARRYLIKLIPKERDVLIFKGENRLDILKINKADLVCISNAQNYIEIFYIENNKLHSKLIRSSLKKVLDDFGFLVQIHRSHLINPSHFKSWRNSNTIILTQIELPVSKNYKDVLLAL
ncbi:LytTR family DNA-binding domain-containing protein [Flavobacterium johnsoniae]|uniref:Response regulator receiver protein n=1 Tax=Flavobacterium johnsoniae (strain ATCC 17061 / DSM 2064 / JCM 8514 / BCRC 14874 / CCUG 350202 / NBRC 14942 / NCIMB 11054 / UW101) TaxID=376686 RepID=A5FM58_FLAJ1|nr:LytTR family DNA-binding domain-containing protein [Flavobacterium johnsoniae]ABQ03717.1 response regulator receiver protein [Flavobacterium johnsoniae UW101]OXG03241.1 histidine kinase [Flavobacterium johnsoniae UW101]WQG79420.1 LytTR family DNA-binding domain-containing protein [Flavobacterium johnsoniae UW101]SHK00632.1 transcriptional regulator, LytTR family [Flavobacterium johnsoniae]